jgi:gliding motility-associated-like protein
MAPYQYSWSTGATTQDLSNLTAGQYILTITDANGCTIPTLLSVLVDEPLPVSISGITVDCPVPGSGISTVTVTPSGGNNGPYQVSYDNGNSFDAPGIYITALPVDSVYYIVVTDGNGCVSPLTDTLRINPEVSIASISFNRCFTSGTTVTPVTVVPVGGDGGPYLVSFDSGVTYNAQGVYTQNLPIANTYGIVVRDLTGCQSDTFTITIPDTMSNAVALSQFAGGNNISCSGSTDGSVSLSVSGGTQPYAYAWSNGSSLQNISGLSAGTYSVVITDANGCLDTATAMLVQPNALLGSAVVTSDFNGYSVSCNGSVNGAADLTVNGGTAAYTYLWNTGATTEDVSAIGAGTYSVLITDANGCTATDTIILTQPAAIQVSSSVQDVPCNGFATGAIDLSVNGGVAAYTYAWSNSATSEDISGLPAGTYSVTVTDLNGCAQTYSVTVNQQSPLVLAGTASDPSCYGDLNGGVSLTVTGGTPAYSFTWSNGSTAQDLTGAGTGSYTVVVTDMNQCTSQQTYTLNQPDSLFGFAVSPVTYSGHNVSQHGSSDGAIDLQVSGGTGPYSYSWSNGSTAQDLSGIPAGTYMAVITDANGCSYTVSITLSEPLSLEMPTGFSPNSDGTNDLFVIHGIEAYPNNKLVVFNRWGNEVYSQTGYANTWDGRNNKGDLLPDGTYFVIVDINSGEIVLKGYVDLRK